MRLVSEEMLSRHLAALPTPTPRVLVGGNGATPWQALRLVDAALPSYRLFVLNAAAGIPERAGVVHETPFIGPGMRGRDGLQYLPCRLSLVPALLRTTTPPDVVVVSTSAPRQGTVSLGIEVNILPAAIEAVRSRGGLVIAQVNRFMPYTYGDAVIDLEDIDFAIEVDEPLPEPPDRAVDEVSHRIAEQVAGLVPAAATLQLGIGGVPDAVLVALRARRELRIWSEMISDGVLALEQQGALDRDVPVVTSFAVGSRALYDWLDGNRRVVFSRTERTNDPAVIARQPAMTSVNSALQVDLFGQANASYVHGRAYSGFGGQTDFIVGALHAHGGKAIIALPSWHARADVSTIVPTLCEPATSFQQSFVVTDQGVAQLWGASQHEQTRELIDNAAHPDARESLREHARRLGLA
jgi:acyl-CoA hydrolase